MTFKFNFNVPKPPYNGKSYYCFFNKPMKNYPLDCSVPKPVMVVFNTAWLCANAQAVATT